MIKWVYVPDKTNHSTMLEYKIITSYYYDGMGNKVMTIAEVDPDSAAAVGYRCNNDTEMYSLYASCTECVDALGLKATYYGREAGGKTLALYDTDPGMTDAYNFPLSCTFNYKYIWLDDWYIYGSEADGRITTVDPKEIIAVNGSRMTGSEFPHPLNEYGASPPPDNLLPTAMRDTNIFGMNASYQVQQRIPDFRRYEIKDHLGNVRTVISDVKNPELTAPPIAAWKYKADVKNISNMYPYGKSYGTNGIYNAADDYRYGFNGMEKERNLDASGDITDFGARVFDANFPVFLSPDPLEREFASQSAYVFASNTPIDAIDNEGKATVFVNGYRGMGEEARRPKENDKVLLYVLYPRVKVPYLTRNDYYNYWGNMDDLFLESVSDGNTFYADGHAGIFSTAEQRYKEGQNAGLAYINQVNSGEIIIEDNEDLIVILHSQGDAYGAGFVSIVGGLFKNVGDSQIYVYSLAAKQGGDVAYPNYVDRIVQYYSAYDIAVAPQSPLRREGKEAGKGIETVLIEGVSGSINTPGNILSTWGHHSVSAYFGIFNIPQNIEGAVRPRENKKGGKLDTPLAPAKK